MKSALTGKQLVDSGWKAGPWFGAAIKAAERHVGRGGSVADCLAIADSVRTEPDKYADDTVWGELARLFIVDQKKDVRSIRTVPVEYVVCGSDIDPEAVTQLEHACLLPIAVRGFLAPDGHVGYGVPIGGVLATDGAVVPWAVGVDIACRMKLSIIDAGADKLDEMNERLAGAIEKQTLFGMGGEFSSSGRRSHRVMDDPAWGEIAAPTLRALKDRAWSQLGSSGSGNHFVEWGQVNLSDDSLGIPAGNYVALLSHSGSRGFGSKVASYYSSVAESVCRGLPKQLQRLAWLDMAGDGAEYWHAMELAGRYAAANHDCIHEHVIREAGLTAALQIENHHNFAWKEVHDGKELIVHRKGATPAGKGVLGVIPGSMADPGYIVRGKGDPASMCSASHGAGRRMSRTNAKMTITSGQMKAYLEANNVMLLSGGLDESPMAYKDIRAVMAEQAHLVEIVGEFRPRIVKMAKEEGKRRE